MIHMGSVDRSGWAMSESRTHRTARSKLALPGICDMMEEAWAAVRGFWDLGVDGVMETVDDDVGSERPNA